MALTLIAVIAFNCEIMLYDCQVLAGPKAERSKSSDLDCGWGDPGSNPGEGRNFFYFLSRW